MRLLLAHARSNVVQLARYPTFAIPTILLPTLFFVLFGLPQHSRVPANVLMASFTAFAVLGVTFFQFGVGVAVDREMPWETFLRTLALPTWVRFTARLVAAIVFSFAACALVIAVAAATTPVSLAPAAWLRFVVALVGGSIPLGLLGIALGYWVSPKGALPIANILYLGFAYAGGLWTGPERLPHVVETLGPYVPTRQWGNVVWEAVTATHWQARHWLVLALYTALFGFLAAWGYRRDEGQRFR